MAKQGFIEGTVYNRAGNETDKYEYLLNWTVNSQSVHNNTSNITIELTVKRTDSHEESAYSDSNPKITFKIGDTEYFDYSQNDIDTRNLVTCSFMTWTGDVAHNSLGNLDKVFSASFTVAGPNSLARGSVSGQLDIDRIIRPCKINSFSYNTSNKRITF
jgi:hypothetical protein